MLEIKNISVNYKQGKGYINVLKDISLSVNKGECLSIVGVSGCGKTTLLNVIGGVIQPASGEVVFDGKPITQYKNDIAVVSQDYGLFPWETVRKNIMLPLKLKKEKDRDKRTNYMLEKLGLEHVKNSYPSQLSGGQKQRTAIARGLLSEPILILLDEPFTALDPMMREKLYLSLYSYFKQNNIMVIIVTHNIQEAVYFGDKILVLPSEDGQRPGLIENHTAGSMARDDGRKIQQDVRKAFLGEF